jgi:predicted lipoprotein with Yx(FWY)xxD motif
MRDTTRVRGLLAAAGIAVIVVGCAQSGAGGGYGQLAASQPAASEAAAMSEAPGGSPAVYTVALVSDANLGMILTGEGGKTLYVSSKDAHGISNCSGNCATTWPAFTLDAGETAVAGTGVSGTIATITRADGSTQVTINGKPLYYFSGDQAAGQTNGEGVNNQWYAAGADGSAVQGPAPSASAGGYHY